MIRAIATEEERIRLIRECQQSGLSANECSSKRQTLTFIVIWCILSRRYQTMEGIGTQYRSYDIKLKIL